MDRRSPFRAAVLLSLLALVDVARADPSTTTIEQGYDRGSMPGPRSVGMAGALYAHGATTTALDINPANLATAKVFHVEALAGYMPEARRQIYGGAAVDSVSNRYGIAGGMSVLYSSLDPDGIDRSWLDLRFGAAMPFAERFSIGVMGRYVRGKQDVASGPFGKSLVSDGSVDSQVVNHPTVSAGINVLIVEGLRIGVAGHNLTVPKIGWLPTTVGGGIGYSGSTFTVEASSFVDLTTWSKPRVVGMGGLELFFADRIALRGGYRYDDGLRVHAISGGLGYVDPKWSLEFGFRRDVGTEHPSTMLSIAVRIFVPSPAAAGSGSSFF